MTEAETRVMVLWGRGQELRNEATSRSWRGKEVSCPQSLQKEPALLTPSLWLGEADFGLLTSTSISQKCYVVLRYSVVTYSSNRKWIHFLIKTLPFQDKWNKHTYISKGYKSILIILHHCLDRFKLFFL